MTLELLDTLIHWLGGFLAYTALALVFLGIWSGTRRQAGRTTGTMGAYLRSPLFYLVTSLVYFGLCWLAWVPLPLSFLSPPHPLLLALGALLYFPGMSLVIWSRLALGSSYFVSTGLGAQLFSGHQLVTRGPYALVRHPMYLGIFLAACGSLFIYHTWTTLFFVIFAPFLTFRARREEIVLAAEFGADWHAYTRRVPPFFPWPSRRH